MDTPISQDIGNALGFYVYAYIDPRDNSVFYIGKGSGSRATDHLFEKKESAKVARINSIRAAGLEPRIDILAHKLQNDLESIRVETALIELIGVEKLTNIKNGHLSRDYPRRPLQDFIIEHAPKTVDVIDPALLFRINREYKYGMTEKQLYEITRGIWVIGERRNRAKFAMAVYAGLVREVYEIEAWHPAGTTPYERDISFFTKLKANRWEFTGRKAPETVRSKYCGCSVAHLFQSGQQSPIVGIRLNT